MLSALAMLVALSVDSGVGWPDRLYRRVGHPVTWLGALIAMLDRRWNRPDLAPTNARARGAAAVAVTLGAATLPAVALASMLPDGIIGALLAGILAWPLVAARALYTHVAAVAYPLAQGDLQGARRAVAMIVGRDPEQLDASGIARAALESLAENASDGIVAPLFWGVLAGLPGIAAYKAINTLDSMIGHRSPRHLHFGWAAARLDDVVNLIPARLTALLLAATAPEPRAALACMRRDARAHRSPNAGWPEAAMAGGHGIRLSGPRSYGDRVAPEPWLNGEAPDPTPAQVGAALRHYSRAMIFLGVSLAALALPAIL